MESSWLDTFDWYIYISSRLNWILEHKVIKICFHSMPSSSFETKISFLKQVHNVYNIEVVTLKKWDAAPCITMVTITNSVVALQPSSAVLSTFPSHFFWGFVILDPTRKLGRRQKKWAIFWKKKKAIKKLLSAAKQTLSSFSCT